MRNYVTELIGTFFLVFTVSMAAVAGGAGTLAGLAIGSVLMVMIFAGGHISGAHYNPAVSMAVFARGKISAGEMVKYWVAQFVGAGLAAGLASGVFKVKAATPLAVDLVPVVVAELLFTFALAYVVLNVATAKGTANNSFYGLAIGFTVLAGAYAVGSISGGVFNPAVGLGITILGVLNGTNLAIYVVTQLIAGFLAAQVFRLQHPGE